MRLKPVIGSFYHVIEPVTTVEPKATQHHSQLDLLFQIAKFGGSVSPGELQRKSGVSLERLGEFLSGLRGKRFIEMEGPWGNEIVRITCLGRSVVEAANYWPLENTLNGYRLRAGQPDGRRP